MKQNGRKISEKVVETVARARGEEPLALPPLETTISADALNSLFHTAGHPPDAYTLFPFCDLWVVVHSDGTVDVFEEYAATSAGEKLPDDVPEPAPDERLVLLYVAGEEYTFYEEDLDTLHRIIREASDSAEAWDDAVEYAQQS